MGTTNIGENPSTSICDINLERHSQKGVYLVNPGVFPTGSNQNPTSMMIALTFKLAEFLKSSS
jgi:choline dehydrogenase-like flavoprotein